MAQQHLCPCRERDKCDRIFRSPGEAATHAKEIHEDPTVACPYVEEFECHRLFGTQKGARGGCGEAQTRKSTFGDDVSAC